MKRISRSSYRASTKEKGSEVVQEPTISPVMKDLHDFLLEAELSEYYLPLLARLKVSTVEHLKYVREQDLENIGMTRPEIRRMKKFYKKECPQGPISKLKRAILKGSADGATRTTSPSSPTKKVPQPCLSNTAYVRPPGRQLISLDSIHLGRTLGEGEFGVVQQGLWRTELGEMLQVAVKRLSRERMNAGRQNFLKEAAIMQEIDHGHIVRMFGVVMDTDNNLMLVTELAPMRSLLECLKDPNLRVDLPVTRLCDYAVQVCDGMSYLESKRMVHRDLAARNILVFNKYQVKISDLGLSRLLEVGQDYYQSRFCVGLKLPIAWCAPECINFLKFTSASDVWSFGVVLWEFFTYGFQPWAGLNGQQILQAIDEPTSQRLEQPELCTNEIYKLMRECWRHEPESRPSFAEIFFRLPQLRPTQVKALKDYPSPLVEKGYIYYKAGDIIVVIDKSPVTSQPPGLVWKGVVNGRSGLFDPTNAVPFIESNVGSGTTKAVSVVRKDSSRKSDRKIRVDLIGHPQNDLRHTGHIGYDGAVFGDVSFIGDNYDKLPVKVGAGSITSYNTLANGSSERNGHFRGVDSPDYLNKGENGFGQSWISQESLSSNSSKDGRYSPNYLDIDDDSPFSDFKIPDLGTSFDCGSSFMDEVLKALNDKEKQVGSSTASTPTSNKNHFFESNSRTPSSRPEPPLPAPREPKTPSSSSAPPVPAHRLLELPKEKKQMKVKPMSASEEKMVDTALARARELTSHMIGGSPQSPPVSPFTEERSSFFDDDTGIISRLKNSIKRSSSPRAEHKRTFSEDLHKGDLVNEVTPEAQQAYNMLVVKGSFKEKSASDSHPQRSVPRDIPQKDNAVSKRSVSRTSSKNSQEVELDWLEPDLIRDSKISTSPSKVSVPTRVSPPQRTTIMVAGPPSAPLVTATSPQPKAKQISAPKPRPPPPNLAPTSTPQLVKADALAPHSHSEIQRSDQTGKHQSPGFPSKPDLQTETQWHMPAFKEHQSKKTLETELIDGSGSIYNGVLEKTSTSFVCSSAHASQRSQLNASQSAEPELEKELSNNVNVMTSYSDDMDLLNNKQASSFLVEDISAPSSQENMSKLRARRLKRYGDQLIGLAELNEASNVETTARQLPAINAKTFGKDSEKDRENDEEVDTNPFRMLRGGPIPVRTAGRGTGNHGNRGTISLRVPQLNFSKHLSKIAGDHQKTQETSSHPRTPEDAPTGALTSFKDVVSDKTKEDASLSSQPTLTDVPIPPKDKTEGCAGAREALSLSSQSSPSKILSTTSDETGSVVEVTRELEKSSLTEVRDPHLTTKVVTEEEKAAKELQKDLAVSLPPASFSCQSHSYLNSHSPSQDKPLDAHGTSQKVTGESLAPPRLPPRRSQSLNENSEKGEVLLSMRPCNLRRSNSVEDSNDTEAPALPPRQPHPGRTPLNARPRERKFPLQIHLPSVEKPSRPQLSSPRQASGATSTPKYISQLKPPGNVSGSPPTILSHQQPPTSSTLPRTHTGFHNEQQLLRAHSQNSPTHNSPHRRPAMHSSLMSQSLDSSTARHHIHHHQHYHSNSVELPPAYDLSVHQSSSTSSVADSEPTHMLLDPHTPHLPLPLSVSLPPVTDLSSVDEPTHVSLSSLIDNKHSWSATFTSPSPLSPSFHRRQCLPTHSSQSSTGHRLLDRSLSHETRTHGPTLYPDFSDNQSPPADLPPAPPTPSYREKLGLEQQKPKVSRSISHNPHTNRCGQHSLTVDSLSSPSSFRGRSSSTNSPSSCSHHITSPSHTSSKNFHSLNRSFNINDDDDDAFFAEAPSYPHPYSQSPFHPLVHTSSKDMSQSTSIYGSIPFLLPASDISPYQVSSAISQPNQPCHVSSPLISSHSEITQPALTQRKTESHSTSSHAQAPAKPVSTPPRTTSTHLSSTITLPPSHQAPISPRNTALRNCAAKSISSIGHKPEEQTIPPSNHLTSHRPERQHTNPSSQVFKFPSMVPTSSTSSSTTSATIAHSDTHPRHISSSDLSPTVEYSSSSEVSPLMFASYTAASSASYEDLRQFALDRQKNCEEIETLLKIFQDQVTVEECMTALEGTQWDVTKATKYLQLKKLLTLGVADVHKCKEALSATGWNLQCAAETLLESSRASSSSSLTSSSRGSPVRSGIITSHNRPASPEVVDV